MSSRPRLSRTGSSTSTSSSQLSLQLDDDGIPHFQDMVTREKTTENSPIPLASPERPEVLAKHLTEKQIRSAEEEQEKRTMGLLHKLDQIDRTRVEVDRDMEAQCAEVTEKLLFGQKNAHMGDNLIDKSVNGPFSPSCKISNNRQRLLLTSPPCSPTRRIISSATVPGTPRASHSQSHMTPQVSGKPSLLTDYLTRSLEEAQVMQSNSLALEVWASRLHELANKFRNEVVELRTQLNISSHDVLSIPEKPTIEDGKRVSTTTAAISSRGDLQTPTLTQSLHEFISPLHNVALNNRRSSKGQLEAISLSNLPPPPIPSISNETHKYGLTPQGGFRVAQVGELKKVRKAKSTSSQTDIPIEEF